MSDLTRRGFMAGLSASMAARAAEVARPNILWITLVKDLA
jgi:hypothetical protein